MDYPAYVSNISNLLSETDLIRGYILSSDAIVRHANVREANNAGN